MNLPLLSVTPPAINIESFVSHSKYAVGSHDAALKMLRSIFFPEKLIVNSDWDLLQRRLP